MNRAGFVFILFIFAALLIGRYYYFFTTQRYLTDGQSVKFVTRLLDISQSEGGRQRFTVAYPSGEEVYVTTSRFTTLRYGERLLVSGTVAKRELGRNAHIFTLSYPEIQKATRLTIADRFYLVIGTMQEKISLTFQKYLSPVHASLLTGIVFGIKDNLPEEFEDDLVRSGVVHVIAASGMNVSMVAAFAFTVFTLFLRRRRAIMVSILILCLYAVLAGLAPSIVRATIMAIIAFAAGFLGRQYFGFLALFFTGYLMLLWNPLYLWDIGFQLSFLATLGILFVRPLEQVIGLEKKPGSKKAELPLTADLKITLAAQIATLPIILANFGEYGLLSLPVNLLVLWTVPYLMILGGIAAICSLALPMLSVPLLYLSYPLLLYFETIVTFFGGLQLQARVEEFPLVFVIAYYLLVVIMLWLIRKIKKQ